MIAALVARAAALSRCEPIPPGDEELAKEEAGSPYRKLEASSNSLEGPGLPSPALRPACKRRVDWGVCHEGEEKS
ncbi:hypothetical protein [Candidatus Palauibacter sp.]|uniref:hypothetical protein n=1 Tax=Candidatus Palauibacter sp. TaxID=3101350 RepID=UPI003AF210DA